jgi:asparagine synthase (glutamine-hydrolysing)
MVKYSIPRILRMVDRNSMAFSVEVRVPFLDHRLVEFVFSLPSNQKIRNGWTKYILRNATKDILPEKIRLRRSKIGFATPEVDWLKKLEHQMMKVFSSKKFGNRKYFNQNEVINVYKKFCQGKLNTLSDSEMFWRILNLELWLEMYIDDWEKWKNKIHN